jgi:hypothetical protein
MSSISGNPRLTNEHIAIPATAMAFASCGHPRFFVSLDVVAMSDAPGVLQPTEGTKRISEGYLNQDQRI